MKMKKNLFMVAAVALVAAVSCNKEGLGDNSQTPSSIVFTAGIDTKTVLVPDTDGDATVNHQIHWESGDEIVVDGVTFKTTDSGAKANFTTESAFTADNDYYAIYPASAGTELESVTVPAAQEVEAGKFNPSAVVSVAKSTTTSLEFKNVTSLLKFQVPAPATTVTISSSSPLAGEVSVNYNAGEPTWTGVNTVNTITVTGSFQTGEDYYVAVLPGAKTNFEVRIDGSYSKDAESVNIQRSMVMDMGKLPGNRIYINNTMDISEVYLYMWDKSDNKLLGNWPGTKISNKAKVNGIECYYIDIDPSHKNKQVNIIVNNNSGKQTKNSVPFILNKSCFFYTKESSLVRTTDSAINGEGSSTEHKLYLQCEQWNTGVNIYAYQNSTSFTGSWPGTLMGTETIEGTKYFYYNVSGKDGQSFNVIFNSKDNNNFQTPGGDSAYYLDGLNEDRFYNVAWDGAANSITELVDPRW